MEEEHPPFYGIDIIRRAQQALIEKTLSKFKNEPVNEDLKRKIHEALHLEKQRGTIQIPFKVILKEDSSGKYAPYIEVLLDSKV